MDHSDYTDEQPAKRRRISSDENEDPDSPRPQLLPRLSSSKLILPGFSTTTCADTEQQQQLTRRGASTTSTSAFPPPPKIAPFIQRYIPQSYTADAENDLNSKFCYRHRPDSKCRRQINEPSMEQLQRELQELPDDEQEATSYVWTVFSAAPAKHRQLILQGILGQCCFSQLSFLSSQVKELIRIDFMSALPVELAFKVLCYLDTTSLCKAAQVSQRWRLLADDDVVWHRMCEQHIKRKCTKCGWGLPLLEQKRLRATRRQLQLRQSLNDDSTESAEDSLVVHQPQPQEDVKLRPWKDVYKDRFKVGCNWKHGRYTTKILRGHSNGVTCLQFDESILASGSYDSSIKIWSLETFAELRTLNGHTAGLRCLQFDESKLISGSLDKTLKVWNYRTGECLRTLSGHSSGVIALHFVGTTLVSGSIDTTVRVWNFEDKSTFVLRGHTDWVNSVKFDAASNVIFSSSDDLDVRMWDVESRSTLRIFKGHVGQVQQVVVLPPEFELEDEDETVEEDVPVPPPAFARSPSHDSSADPPRYILTSGLDSTVRLWDTKTGHTLRTLFGHIEGVWALAADNLRVVSGSEDRMVKVWDARTGKCERTVAGHTGPVTCVGLGDSRMGSGAEDGEVRIYDFRG